MKESDMRILCKMLNRDVNDFSNGGIDSNQFSKRIAMIMEIAFEKGKVEAYQEICADLKKKK